MVAIFVYFFFFFFQAEDGIRDKLVTGVQTCALPIVLASALTANKAEFVRRRRCRCRRRNLKKWFRLRRPHERAGAGGRLPQCPILRRFFPRRRDPDRPCDRRVLHSGFPAQRQLYVGTHAPHVRPVHEQPGLGVRVRVSGPTGAPYRLVGSASAEERVDLFGLSLLRRDGGAGVAPGSDSPAQVTNEANGLMRAWRYVETYTSDRGSGGTCRCRPGAWTSRPCTRCKSDQGYRRPRRPVWWRRPGSPARSGFRTSGRSWRFFA